MHVSSLQNAALNRFLEESGTGRSGPIIPETAMQICNNAGVSLSGSDADGLLRIIDQAATDKSVSNLRGATQGVIQLNCNSAIQVGAGEKPRRAVIAASKLLEKDALAYTLHQAVFENVGSGTARLALTKASEAQLSLSGIHDIFYKAVSHPSENVQMHVLSLLRGVVPNEGRGKGIRQQILIKAAQSSYPGSSTASFQFVV